MIQLQFVCGSSISSRLIAWYGNGYGGYSHVDAVMPDGSLIGARNDAVGGQPPGVQRRPVNYEAWVRRAVVTIPSTTEEAHNWRVWVEGQINCAYDQQAIWGFILGRAEHTVGRWICSALQFGALQSIGRLKRAPVPASQVTPDALLLLTTAGLGGTVWTG